MTLRLLLCGLSALLALLAGCGEGASATAPPPSPAATGEPAAVVARGKVEVPGGLLEVAAPMDGSIASLAVAEGQAVRRGQLLALLANPALEQDASIAAAELALARSRQQQLGGRIGPARALLDRLAQAEQGGAADPVRTDEARQALREAEAASQVGAAEVRLAQAKLAAVQAQLERRRVTAPTDGLVQTALAQPGSRVAAGRPLLALLPARPLRVRAEVNEALAGAVHTGMRASVVPDGPLGPNSVPLTGQVVRVAAVYGVSRLDEEPQVRGAQRVLECWVELESAGALRAGQWVRVNLHE